MLARARRFQTFAARIWILNQLDWDQHSRTQEAVLNEQMMCICCRKSHAGPLTGWNGLTTLELIQGDTQPSNLLSFQFQRTMELRTRQYTPLLTAVRLAARLMRWRLPIREPNGVKIKVLLWTNTALPYWELPIQLYTGSTLIQANGFWKGMQTVVDVVKSFKNVYNMRGG